MPEVRTMSAPIEAWIPAALVAVDQGDQILRFLYDLEERRSQGWAAFNQQKDRAVKLEAELNLLRKNLETERARVRSARAEVKALEHRVAVLEGADEVELRSTLADDVSAEELAELTERIKAERSRPSPAQMPKKAFG